jgi:hypothetical protein
MMMIPTEFLATIEAFLAKAGMTASRFGKDAVGDPNFVLDIRNGRSPSIKVAMRALEFIEAQKHTRASEQHHEVSGA